MNGFKGACLAGAMALGLAAAAQANHGGANQLVLHLSRTLVQQAAHAHRQAHTLIAGGWGASWQDRRAAEELGQFVQAAQQLAVAAQQHCGGGNGGWNGGGNNGGWNGGNNGGWNGRHGGGHNGGWNGGGNNGGWNGGGSNGGWNGGNPVNPVVVQLLRQAWRQANAVERNLYQAPRLQQVRGFWDYQVSGTLRQLRQAVANSGGSPYREERRGNLFEKLFGNF